jgi:hypothetical protein
MILNSNKIFCDKSEMVAKSRDEIKGEEEAGQKSTHR